MSISEHRNDWGSGSPTDPIVHLIVMVRGGTRMEVAGIASSPPEQVPYRLPPPGTGGLNEYEIVGLAKAMERLYGKALSYETTWNIRDCDVDPWPPSAAIGATVVADGEHRGLPFADESKYWVDIRISDPGAIREICWCAVRERSREPSSAAKSSQSSSNRLLSLEGPDYKLTIRIPPDWLQSKTNAGYVLRPANAKSLPSSEGPVFSPGILLMSAPIQKPIRNTRAFVNGWFNEESQKMFHRFELVSQRASEVSGCPASWFEFQFDKLGHRWAAIVLVTSDGRVVHYADGSLLVSDQSLWYKIVKDVLESFCVSYQTRTQGNKWWQFWK